MDSVGESQTDIDRFVELYRSVGIEIESRTDFTAKWATDRGATQALRIKADRFDAEWEPVYQDKLTGYGGFYTDLYFDEHGKFVGQGIWE